MEVYIEYAIIDNLIMDYLLLYLSARLVKTKVHFWLLCLGAIIGTIVAIIMPLINLAEGTKFLIKIALCFLVCLVSAEHKSVFNYFKFVNCFVLLTFAVGGTIIAVLEVLNIDYSSEGVRSAGMLPIGVNIAVMVGCFYIVKKLTKCAIGRLNNNFICDIEIISRGNSTFLKGFLDSGNTLVDVKSGLPVMVCGKVVASSILDDSVKPFRYMPISTASGIGMIALYNIDGAVIRANKKTVYCDAVLGVSDNIRSSDADIILGANLI